jgi:hypothetical protein
MNWKATLAAAALSAIAFAAPANAADSWGERLNPAPDATCANPCFVHTKVQANGFPVSGSPAVGVVTQVKLKHKGDGGAAELAVLKHKGGNQFENRALVPITVAGHSTATVQTFATRFSIGSGERLALHVTPGIAGDLVMSGADADSECYKADPHAVGSTSAYFSGMFCSAVVLLQATVEPDADGDGYGDETQDPDKGRSDPIQLAPEPNPDQLAPRDPVRTEGEEPRPPLTFGECEADRVGTELRDVLRGTSLGDRLDGRGGHDLLYGLDGKDCLSGGAGKDRLFAGDGMDRLNGGRGRDFLAGGRGRDKMTGGAGADTYKGGTGDDRINAVGGTGDRGDRIDCGPGRDVVWVDRGDSTTGCERKVNGDG